VKKRLFITSILTIALLAVALSTATFAWFSASSTVNVSVISFTASSDDGESKLAISWNETLTEEEDGKSIEFSNAIDMKPMIPKTLPQIGQSYDSFMTIRNGESNVTNFHSAVQTKNPSDNNYYYSSRAMSEAPSVCKSLDKDGGKEIFYLINSNLDCDMAVTVIYTISGDNGSALCVAIFADDKLAGIMSNDTRLYYGEIEQGGRIDEQTSAQGVTAKTGEITFIVPAGKACPMRLVAWYSGTQIDDGGAGKEAMLSSLKFEGTYIA